MSVKKGTKTFHRLRRPPRIQRKVRNLDFCVKFSGVLPRYAEGRLWEAARLASLLGGGASRIAFGRRCVSRRFWETARLASLWGGGASRVAFGRRCVSPRFWEAARLASLLKKFLSLGGAASEARRSGWGYSAFQTTPPLRGTPPREGNFRRIATRSVVCCAGGSASPSRCRRLPRYALFLRNWTGQN